MMFIPSFVKIGLVFQKRKGFLADVHKHTHTHTHTHTPMHTMSVVKCTLVQALRLCTGRTAHRGSRGIALPFHDHGTRRGWGFSVRPRPLFTPGKDSVPIVQKVGWVPGPVWTGAENLAPTGIRSPDRPARSQSLYWLRYPAHHVSIMNLFFSFIRKESTLKARFWLLGFFAFSLKLQLW